MSREEATSAVVSFPVSAPVLNPNCIQVCFFPRLSHGATPDLYRAQTALLEPTLRVF